MGCFGCQQAAGYLKTEFLIYGVKILPTYPVTLNQGYISYRASLGFLHFGLPWQVQCEQALKIDIILSSQFRKKIVEFPPSLKKRTQNILIVLKFTKISANFTNQLNLYPTLTVQIKLHFIMQFKF